MSTKIVVKKGNEINLEEIVEMTYKVKNIEFKKKQLSYEKLLNIFQENFFVSSVFYVLARINGKIIGWLLLYPTSPTNLALNIGDLLGGHPVIDKGYNADETSSRLLDSAKDIAIKHGFSSIEIMIPWDLTDPNVYTEYIAKYSSNKFEFKLKYVEMICNIELINIPYVGLKNGYSFKRVSEFDEEEIYKCYLNAFSEGDARFFAYQGEQEKREYFNSLSEPDVLYEDSSIVLMFKNQIIGFSYVLKFEEENHHISCMCILPEFQGNGLGKYLLFYIMNKVYDDNAKTITLGTETDMKAFKLYEKYGFNIIKGYMVFNWIKN